MTDPRVVLAEIQQRADAATDGPWLLDVDLEDGRWDRGQLGILRDPYGLNHITSNDMGTMWFIAADRTDVPRLVKAVEAALTQCYEFDKPGLPIEAIPFVNRLTRRIRRDIAAALAGES